MFCLETSHSQNPTALAKNARPIMAKTPFINPLYPWALWILRASRRIVPSGIKGIFPFTCRAWTLDLRLSRGYPDTQQATPASPPDKSRCQVLIFLVISSNIQIIIWGIIRCKIFLLVLGIIQHERMNITKRTLIQSNFYENLKLSDCNLLQLSETYFTQTIRYY